MNPEYGCHASISSCRLQYLEKACQKSAAPISAQWKFSGDKHKSLQVDTERTFHQRCPLVML